MVWVMIAKYDGVCEECGEKITKGRDEIIKGDSKAWIHVICPETFEETKTKFQGTTLDEMGY